MLLVLAAYSRENSHAIVAEGAIPALIALLQASHAALRDPAAELLREISLHPEHCPAIAAGGGLPPLIALLELNPRPVHALQTLRMVVSTQETAAADVVERGGLCACSRGSCAPTPPAWRRAPRGCSGP